MTASCPGAAFIADAKGRKRRKVAARPGALRVDRAARLSPDLPRQGNAARRACIGATHAHQRGGDGHGQRHRHAAAGRGFQIGHMEIHPETGATGAAIEAGVGWAVHRTS